MEKDTAVVLLSGGMDSTVALKWALGNFKEVHPIFIDYGQPHIVEYEAALRVGELLGVEVTSYNTPYLKQMYCKGMFEEGDIIVNRNAMLILIAHSYSLINDISHIVGGMCGEDFAGFPDCREDFLQEYLLCLDKGMNTNTKLHIPLQKLDKRETFNLADKMGILSLVVNETHTCYEGDRTKLHTWGYGCGTCSACINRKIGWVR